MNRIRYMLILGIMLLLTGCDQMAILNPKGIIAASEKSLLVSSTFLMLLIVIPVIVLTFIIAWKYRASNKAATYSPEWSHSTKLEIIWWSIPCLLILVLATMTWISSHRLDPYRPIKSDKEALIIQVVALDWKWLFIYPEQHIATVNFVQVPVDVPVRFLITSDAPMNSFEIPQLAGQIYAMTGMQTKLNIVANEAGDYKGLSTNFSGDGFNDMNFIVRAGSQDDFNQWVSQVQQTNHELSINTYKTLAKPSENEPVAFYSSVANNLYHKVMMKYMAPGMTDMGEPEVAQLTTDKS